MTTPEIPVITNFIRAIIEDDLASGKHSQIQTRFPPEPNGYLHIGHAKSICLNFGIAEELRQAQCNLRFDDTNPEKETDEYARSIEADVKWLGFQWSGEVKHASDYFEQLYQFAVELIRQGNAYVDDLTPEQMREYRGTLTEAGKDSPFRERSIAENLQLFQQMRAGDFADGQRVLRAKIDMASPNINLRDPVLYRIRRAEHIRTGDQWCIYPMYDYTHCISDALENITHSLCTLEFEAHRPLYDWVLDQLPQLAHPRQIEFSRLELQYTVTSKRKLNELVTGQFVEGWDDPRMPTLAGMRRRGYRPQAIREFAKRIGVAKSANTVDMSVLEGCVREDLEQIAPRAMAVLKPLKLVLTNYPESQVEWLSVPAHPNRPELGNRQIPFSREVYIDQDDFMEQPPKGFHRLTPGGEVRLRAGYIVRCDEVIKNEQGEIVELRGQIDPDTLGKMPEGRKVKGVIHWVSCAHAIPAEVRLYDRLFTTAWPDADKTRDFKEFLNPASLAAVTAWLEPSLADAQPGQAFQFERVGYFVVDNSSLSEGKLIFNRTVGLKDSWAKENKA